MPLSHDEVLALVDEVNVAMAEVIANFAQLKEGMVDDGATDAAQAGLERLKQKTDDAKRQLSDLKNRQRHRREMERQRKEHERERSKAQQTEGKSTKGRVALLNAKGQWIGFVESLASGNVNIYDSRGRLVSRQLAGLTLDRAGRFVGRGRQMRAISTSPKWYPGRYSPPMKLGWMRPSFVRTSSSATSSRSLGSSCSSRQPIN